MPVFINNVDDYLGPSQACVNPLFAAPPPPNPPPSTQSSDAHHVNGNGMNKVSSIANNNDDAKATATDANPTPQRVVQNRRVRRRAPRIIKCEEEGSDDAPSTTIKSKQPIRLVAADEKDVNDNNLHTSPPVTNTTATTSQTTHTIKRKKATVTLSDCLSCSGCVTSAEAVLMSHHSIDTLREMVCQHQHQQRKRIVFTISSASMADLYRHLYLENDGDDDEISASPPPTTETTTNDTKKSPSSSLPSRHDFLTTITSFLQTEFNAIMVIDGAITQQVSLIESAFEFCYRYNHRKRSTHEEEEEREDDDDIMMKEVETTNESMTCGSSNKKKLSSIDHDSSMPSVAVSSTRTRYINKQPNNNNGNKDIVMDDDDDDTLMEITTLKHPPGRINIEDVSNNKHSTSSSLSSPLIQSNSLPMLTSSCPGFVCLVEKTTPSIVPLLSSTKSPMSIAGILVKTSSSSQYSTKKSDDNNLLLGEDDNVFHVAISGS